MGAGGLPEVRGTKQPPLPLRIGLGGPGPLPVPRIPLWLILQGQQAAYPELAEVGIGGVIGLVVGVQQDGDDALLLLRQPGPQAVLQGLLLLPLQDHLPLPLHLLIGQDDCGQEESIGRAGSAAPPGNLPLVSKDTR